MFKVGIHFPVEGLSDFTVERNYEIGIILVQYPGEAEKCSFTSSVVYRNISLS